MIKNHLIFFGSLILLIMLVIGIFGPIFLKYDPSEINVDELLMPPSAKHIFGTDQLGRDVLTRMVYGARVSLSVGFIAVGISTLVGIFFGAIAGFFGGRIDSIIMRFVDMMLCFPTFFLLLTVVSVLEPSILNIMVIIGLTSWMSSARIMRAEVLKIKELEYVLAARSLGASNSRIIIRHIIPNCIGPILVSSVLGMASAILIESALSFLGLGVQPPTPSWGNILIDGKSTLGIAWWLTIFPGSAILITILAINILGEGIREQIK
ncbi:MAG: ABC transporter permease [Candidatus Omnitrophota bacterium]